jgi:hypothetical protein
MPVSYSDLLGGEVLPIIINSGHEFVDASRSDLTFQLKINSQDQNVSYYRFDTGDVKSLNSGSSVLNLISQVQLESRSGELLVRENFAGIMQTVREYRINQEYKNKLGMMGGFQATTNTFPMYPINTFTTFSVPMALLAPIFNTASLMPPELISGAVLRLQMNIPSKSVILFETDGQTPIVSPITCDISTLSIYLQTSQLFDGIHSVLKHSVMKMNRGLSFPYYQNFNSIFVPTSSSFVYDIQLAAAKVSYVAIKFLDNDAGQGILSPIGCASLKDLNNDVYMQDPNGLPFSIQCRVGQLVIPLFPIVSAVEAYKMTCDALSNISYACCEDVDVLKNTNKLSTSCVPYNYYNFSEPSVQQNQLVTGVNRRGTMFAFGFERSQGVNLGGLSTNSNKTISIEINGLPAYESYKLYAQVQYLSVASIFEDNVVLSK